MGEKLGLAQKFLRRLDHPSLDKLEGTIDYWSPAAYDTEVHAGSGVSSHAYYLLAEGSGRKTDRRGDLRLADVRRLAGDRHRSRQRHHLLTAR